MGHRPVTDLRARLRQRKLVQWALTRVAFSFALLQGIDIVAHPFTGPDRMQRLFLVPGFFVALLLARCHGPRGVQKVRGTPWLRLAIGGRDAAPASSSPE